MCARVCVRVCVWMRVCQLTELGFVTELDVSYNRIDRLPPSLSSMHGLRVCVLAANAIDRLPAKARPQHPRLHACSITGP